MPKVKYNDITFDSELEVEYYKYLQTYNDTPGKPHFLDGFVYHPTPIYNLIGKRSYTPDFILCFADGHAEIVECKGYNPYSKMIDDQIHNVMLSKSSEELHEYYMDFVIHNLRNLDDSPNAGCSSDWLDVNKVIYKKVKYLKAYGFVDWDFKNPNTIANKRKEKINEQSAEIKELRDFKKEAERYFRYHLKIVNNEKLTKPQKEWYYKYVEKLRTEYGTSQE